MRPVAMIGSLALCLAFGAVIVGHFMLTPQLAGADAQALVDPNLARALAAPLSRRCSEILLVSALVLTAVLPRWTRRRFAGPLALATAGLAAADRLYVLPRLHAAWSKVDLVARRPASPLAVAERLDGAHTAMMVTAALALVVLLALTLARSRDDDRTDATRAAA